MAGGQLLMEAGDLVLYTGEGSDRRHRPLTLGFSPLDQRARVRQPGCQVLFSGHRRSVGRRLLPSPERLGSRRARLPPVEALRAQGHQRTRPRDGLLAGLLPGGGLADVAACLIERPLPVVGLAFPLIGQALTPVSLPLPVVGLAFPVIGLAFPLIGQAFPLIGQVLTLIGQVLTLVGCGLAVIGRTLARGQGIEPTGNRVPWLCCRPVIRHVLRMHPPWPGVPPPGCDRQGQAAPGEGSRLELDS
jgi:hypothetical protein